MKLRMPISWYDLKDSLWYRPGMMTLAAIILSLITVQLDHYLFGNHRVELPWLFEGGSEGARGVLSAIAGTMMTVATTAFSVTLVALQLGSSQFSPRILRSFTGDVVNQTVLGLFIATFAYSLSVLRTVRSQTEDYVGFVPTISVTISLLLAFIAIGSLIYFFHHSTRTIQASVVIDRTYSDTSKLMRSQYKRVQNANKRILQQQLSMPEALEPIENVYASRAGYLQDSNIDTLVKIGKEADVLVQVHPQLGDYLNAGAKLVTLWQEPNGDLSGDEDAEKSVTERIHDCFELGLERTLELDMLFGMQQLTDIGLLALSPGTNDPTTALQVVDRMGTAVIEAEAIAGMEVVTVDDDGAMRVIQPIPQFHEYARLPFDQIRHYSASDPNVTVHVLRTLAGVASEVSGTHEAEIRKIAREYEESAASQTWIEADHQRVREAAAWAHLGTDPGTATLVTGRP